MSIPLIREFWSIWSFRPYKWVKDKLKMNGVQGTWLCLDFSRGYCERSKMCSFMADGDDWKEVRQQRFEECRRFGMSIEVGDYEIIENRSLKKGL